MSFIGSSYDGGEIVIPTVSETEHRLIQDLYDNVKGNKHMNNDLISREALKEEFKRIYRCAETAEQLANNMEDAIDNAPTVPNEYMRGYEASEREYKRPQGEWIDYSEDGYVECPICKHLTTCEDNIDELHYCWNCGAKMQKGGAEE